MWFGGVRVLVPDQKDRVLMVCQEHEGKMIWMLPGGGIEEAENAAQAAEREVLEETGLQICVKDLLWHVEEVSEKRGQRFVNFFSAEIISGNPKLGKDPEFDEQEQVLRELRFLSLDEIDELLHVYPAFLKEELRCFVTERKKSGRSETKRKTFRLRENDI